MGGLLTTLILDTHVVHWWSSEPSKLSKEAASAIARADELAICAITWYELAWLATHNRIGLSIPLRTWLSELDARLRTIALTPEIGAAAVSLPAGFPKDPADRLIYATALTTGFPLVTKDAALRDHPQTTRVTVW